MLHSACYQLKEMQQWQEAVGSCTPAGYMQPLLPPRCAPAAAATSDSSSLQAAVSTARWHQQQQWVCQQQQQ